MIRNLLIAAAAAGILATALASSASAKIHVDFNVNAFVPGVAYGEPYPYYPVVDDGYYGGDCGYVWQTYKRWNRWHTAYIVKHKKVLVCE